MKLVEVPKILPQAVGGPVQFRLGKLAGRADFDAGTLTPKLASRKLPIRSELLAYRQGIAGVSALQSGWAALVELLADGRRQIVHLVLPGEIIAYPRPGRCLASATAIAITPVEVCTWRISEDPVVAGAQLQALGASDAVEQTCMINQITRLGRRSAYERLAHFLLEIRERLMLAGIGNGKIFQMPLTQELIADVLGLTSVHINRTLQQLRQDGYLNLRSGVMDFPDPDRLIDIVDYRSVVA